MRNIGLTRPLVLTVLDPVARCTLGLGDAHCSFPVVRARGDEAVDPDADPEAFVLDSFDASIFPHKKRGRNGDGP